MRSVPRITPTAPPRTPMTKARACRAPNRRLARAGAIGPERQVDPLHTSTRGDQRRRAALSETSSATSAPATAPTTDGGAIHATTRQSTRPSRSVLEPAGAGRGGADRDVRPRPRERARRREHDQTAAAASRARARAPSRDSRRRTSRRTLGRAPRPPERLLAAAAAFAARARMKRRSERRFR